MTGSFARDLVKHRIRVNTIVPCWIMTERQKELWSTAEALEQTRQKQCLPNLIDPVYAVCRALFLASNDVAMCTANNSVVETGSV
jgi:NAD(P)-dependent dehydrogenase (short-subunit alcohol dehydrogenase family)